MRAAAGCATLPTSSKGGALSVRSQAKVTNLSSAQRSTRADREVVEGIETTLDVLHGRWKVRLLFLMARGIHRHSSLLQCLPGASKKVMTENLRALQRDGLVLREAGATVGIEYSLTPLGWSLSEPLMTVAEWGSANAAVVEAAQDDYRSAATTPSLRPAAATLPQDAA
jgi:DNA-binding HxlR family transcriptional regulator